MVTRADQCSCAGKWQQCKKTTSKGMLRFPTTNRGVRWYGKICIQNMVTRGDQCYYAGNSAKKSRWGSHPGAGGVCADVANPCVGDKRWCIAVRDVVGPVNIVWDRDRGISFFVNVIIQTISFCYYPINLLCRILLQKKGEADSQSWMAQLWQKLLSYLSSGVVFLHWF